jgi:hypothetical protein
MTRLGYQIPNFTYPDVAPEGIFNAVVAQAKTAEDNHFDRVLLMDHFYQLPGIGEAHDYMLECYTTLAALAQHTSALDQAGSKQNTMRSVFPSTASPSDSRSLKRSSTSLRCFEANAQP